MSSRLDEYCNLKVLRKLIIALNLVTLNSTSRFSHGIKQSNNSQYKSHVFSYLRHLTLLSQICFSASHVLLYPLKYKHNAIHHWSLFSFHVICMLCMFKYYPLFKSSQDYVNYYWYSNIYKYSLIYPFIYLVLIDYRLEVQLKACHG